ncbi:hypothetical protein Taro_048579 [Colocasia esculenta]|uniref:Uncharacterized protein n=1 Tax=Colocasia esculenta TaxID=4460 RepID=A0A843X8I2_COLES|nr:hypothetical protein [Colocasia esculenta]
MKDYDAILGLDFLEEHYALVDCRGRKIVRLLNSGRARAGQRRWAVVVNPIASSGSPSQLYVTLGLFRVPGSVGGDRKNRVIDLGQGSSSRGRYS